MQQGGGGPFIGALRVRATRPCAWERQGGDGSARLVARNRASTHARAQSAARQQLQQVRVEATHAQACPIADGCGEVNKTLESRRDSRRKPSLGGYARSTAAVGSGLDGALSTVAARPAGARYTSTSSSSEWHRHPGDAAAARRSAGGQRRLNATLHER
jgi:hypothetical protein